MGTAEVLDSMCAEVARQHEDAPLVASEGVEETETSAAAESGETKKSNKRPSSFSGSKSTSKKAARLAEEAKQQQEETAAAAALAKAEARQHEINVARAKRPDAEILIKDCTIKLICSDSECKSLKSTVTKTVSAMKS